MCSLASANGPSVIAGTPSRTLTVLVLEGSASASPPTSSPDSVSSWMIASTSPISSAPCSPKNTSRVSGLSQISSMYFTAHSSRFGRPVVGASPPYVGASGEVSTSAPAGAGQLHADQARHVGSPGIAVGEERLGRDGRLLEPGALGRLLAADHHRGQLGALLVRVEHLGIDVGDVQLLARLLDVLVEVGDQVLLDRLLGRLQVGPQRLLVSGQLGAAH